MTQQELVKMLKTLKIPLAYRVFSKKQNLPFMVYYNDGFDGINADDKIIAKFKNIVVELYTSTKDFQLEEKLEKLFDDNEIIYEKDETYISEEKMYETIYNFQI